MDKLRLRFEKTGRAVYISHLDLMRTWQRAFSRAGLPIQYSEGFNPHARLSIVLPLPVGMASLCEFLDFGLTEETALDSVPERLNAALPEGIRALEAYPAPEKGAALKWIGIDGRLSDCPRGAEFYQAFFAREPIVVLRRTKRGEREEDLAPSVRSAEFFPEQTGTVGCRLLLSAQEPSVGPELLLKALGDDAPGYGRFRRTAAYRENGEIFR